MWKIFLTITFLTGGQPAVTSDYTKPNPWKIEHRTPWDSKEACEVALKDPTVTQEEYVRFLVEQQFKDWNKNADEVKVEFVCEEKN